MKKFFYNSPLGKMTILADDQKLYGLWFNDQKYFGGHFNLSQFEEGMSGQAKKTIKWLDHYFAGQKPSIDQLKFDLQTTEFVNKYMKF